MAQAMTARLEGVRASRADLVARHGASQRLAVRIGALAASKVELTAAVLEAARPGSPLETLLLKREVLAEAAQLTSDRLVELQGGLAVDLDLVVEESEGRRVIGLEEELVASPDFSAPAAPMAVAMPLALSPVDVDPLAALLPGFAPAAAELFTNEEIGRLRLTVLTGVDAKVKVEALRKLVYAPLPQNEKGLLFLRAVSDESPEVRAEAAAGLKSLGLDAATAASVRALSDGSAPERSAAILSLTKRAAEAGDAERAVVLAALAADLRGQPDAPRAVQLLKALGVLAPHLARNAEFATAVVRIAVRRLFAGPPEVAEAVTDFLTEMGKAGPAELARLVWAEYDPAPDRRAKTQLLLALARIPAAAGPEKLARETARLIADWSDADFDCRRASNALLHLGDVAVDALLAIIPSAPQAQRPFLIRLTDQIASGPGVTNAAVERFGLALVEILKTARKAVRIAAMESRIPHDRITPATRAAIAQQVITAAHDYNLDEMIHLSEACLRRIGGPALKELLKAMKASPYPVERDIALRSIDSILEDDKSLVKEAGDALRIALDLLKSGQHPNEPLLATTAGRIAALSAAPAAAVRGTAMEFRNMLRTRPGRFEILEAYSWTVSSPHVEGEMKMSAGLTLLGLLDAKMPENFVKEDWTNDGLTLTIGKTSNAHTVLIPTLLSGLERIALSGAGTDNFLEKITHGLLAHWKRVTGYEVVWSPGNISSLASALGRIASRRETPLHLRLDVIDALRVRTIHLPVARALGEALALEETSRRMDALCAAVTRDLCDLAVHRDFQEADDRQELLASLSRIGQRKNVAGEAKTSEELRRRIVELLFDGLRDGVPGVREELKKLAAAAGVPKAVKKGIEERLGRTG